MADTLHLHPLFQVKTELLANDERVALSYKRAKLVLQTLPVSVSDVQKCTPHFWALMRHPIMSFDIAMYTILTIHVNLVIGTLSRHVHKRPEFKRLVDSLLRFDVLGLYQLSERAHGVDSFNIETTATKTNTGYILHTPREEAAKFVPASTSGFGVSKVSLVNALLIVDGKNLGARFFVVPICNVREMYKGVTSIRLPPRPGTTPLDWALTRFSNVHLPFSALVAADPFDVSLPSNPREAWWNELWRIQYGSMCVTAPFISGLKASAYITGQYSLHRTVTGPSNKPIPIISFRTQQWVVADAAAAGLIYEKFFTAATELAFHGTSDPRVRHAMIAITKATVVRHVQRCLSGLAERLGAQGTLEHNYIPRLENDTKGVVIAEGDLVPLCNKVFSELLQGQYHIPIPDDEESLLARHASSLLEENTKALSRLGGTRTKEFMSVILPRAQPVVEAIGHAIAYSAAAKADISKPILDVYESSAIRQDPAWYSEHGMSREAQGNREDKAISSLIQELPTFLSALEIENYVTAPVVSDSKWKAYLTWLTMYNGNATPSELISCSPMPAKM